MKQRLDWSRIIIRLDYVYRSILTVVFVTDRLRIYRIRSFDSLSNNRNAIVSRVQSWRLLERPVNGPLGIFVVLHEFHSTGSAVAQCGIWNRCFEYKGVRLFRSCGHQHRVEIGWTRLKVYIVEIRQSCKKGYFHSDFRVY